MRVLGLQARQSHVVFCFEGHKASDVRIDLHFLRHVCLLEKKHRTRNGFCLFAAHTRDLPVSLVCLRTPYYSLLTYSMDPTHTHRSWTYNFPVKNIGLAPTSSW